MSYGLTMKLITYAMPASKQCASIDPVSHLVFQAPKLEDISLAVERGEKMEGIDHASWKIKENVLGNHSSRRVWQSRFRRKK